MMDIVKASLFLLGLKKTIKTIMITFPLVLLIGCEKQHKVVTGYIEGRLSFVSSERSGDLANLFVRRGDSVVAGQKLFLLEERPESDVIKQIQAEIADLLVKREQAKSTLAYDTSVLARRELLATKNVISQEDLDANKTAKKNAAEELNSIDARLETAHAKLEEAKWDKANKMVNSEKAGVVFDTYFLPTEFVTTGKPVLSILSDNDKYIVFYVPEHLLPKFKIKQNLAVICDGVKDPFQATVSFIYPKVEFAPPIIYTDESRTGLVYKVEASVNENTADNGCLHIGQ